MATPGQDELKDPPDYQNRRATVRYRRATPQPGRAFIANSSKSVDALVVDISQGGIGLILESHVEPDTLVRIEMGGDGKGLMVDLLANIAHITPLENNRWRCGCEWTRKLTEDELQALSGQS
jgi:hypothetical protein